MKKFGSVFHIVFLMLTLVFSAMGQTTMSVTTQIGPKSIAQDENFILSFTLTSAENASATLPSYKFPELLNFKKQGVSRAKASKSINGQIVNTYTFSQYYLPDKPGNFEIINEGIEVGNQTFRLEPFSIVVSPALDTEEFTEELLPSELILTSNDPLFVITSNTGKPFVGQGFTLKMSFFVPESNTQEFEFDRNDIQIPALISNMKPKFCWEENFGITTEQILKVSINKKKYTEYRFFQATYFALQNQKIQIPALKFRVISINRKGLEAIKKPVFFTSAPVEIKLRDLPHHPLSEKVPVGNFQLKENISSSNSKTGQSILYTASLIGDGNGALWNYKSPESDYFMNFVPISVQTTVAPSQEKMFGNKTDKIQIILKQPGKFALSHYFNWIYFNVKTEQFDTLRSKIVLDITGNSSDHVLNTDRAEDEVYRRIENKNTLEVSWARWVNWSQLVNLILIFLAIVIAFLVWKKPK
jgi:hypothetical protein